MRTQLLCTFIQKKDIDTTIDAIQSGFTVTGKIFLMKGNDGKYFLSYGVSTEVYHKFLPNSILVHRKRETNTIYTINALNALIVLLNNGVLDKSYSIEWDRYRDMLLVKVGDKINRIGIETLDTYSL